MGAVFGVVGSPPAASHGLISQMHAAMRFRGTEVSSHVADGFAMGASYHPHETGPFLVANKERTVVAVCEGELYNCRDLARAIGASASKGGFGIVPELFERRGRDFPRDMNGIFTIALLDNTNRTVYLARDHSGSHSIFYAAAGTQVPFATTIRALFASKLVKPTLSPSALDGYLACLAVSAPETMFEGVSAVRPGHMAIVKDGAVSEYSYWPFDAVTEDRRRSELDFAEQIRSLFIDAVQIRASYPGNYGVLISGGIDTSAIAAALLQEASHKELDGFSIVFDEPAYSDAALQDHIYRQCAMRRHQLVLRPADFEDALVQGAAHLDSPVNDVAYAGMYKVMELVKTAGLDAAFDGEGSDEIFCTGHSHGERSIQHFLAIPEWLRRSTLGIMFRNMPTGGSLFDKARRFGCRLGMPTHERLSTWAPVMHNQLRRRLHRKTVHARYAWPQTRYYLSTAFVKDPINKYNYLLSRLFLPDDLLYKNERMAAAHGIMNRTPFVDYRLIELAFQVPARFKLQRPTLTKDMTKLIFKRAMIGIVPEPILSRKKSRGFSQPTSIWYRKELRDFVTDLLLSPEGKIGEHLDKSQVSRVCNAHLSGASSLDYHLSSLVVLELWMRSHL